MKRLISIFCIFTVFLSACTSKTNTSENKKDEYKIASASVVASYMLDKLDINIVTKPTTKMKMPERYKDVTEAGMSSDPNFEKIISERGNLLIGDVFFKKNIDEKAKNYNIKTAYIDTSSYEKFMNSILQIGDLLSKTDKAKNIVEDLKKPIEEVKQKYNNKKDLTFAVIFGSSKSNMLATNYSYIGNLATNIGAKNITEELVPDSTSAYVDLSLEKLLLKNPDVILRFSHGDLEASKKNFDAVFESNSVYKSLKAYQNKRIYDLDPEYFNVSADFNSPNAILELGKILYGQD